MMRRLLLTVALLALAGAARSAAPEWKSKAEAVTRSKQLHAILRKSVSRYRLFGVIFADSRYHGLYCL